MNYTTLQSTIVDWMHRSDLASKVPTFIELAEAYLFRELSVDTMETSVTGTTSGSLIALPADVSTVNRITVDYAGRAMPLDYNSQPNNYVRSGVPLSYWNESGGLRLDSGGTGYAYTLYYTPSIQALSIANPTNWLLANAPDLYLTASQIEAAKYTEDKDKLLVLGGSFQPMLDSVQRKILRASQPMRGGMQIKARNNG